MNLKGKKIKLVHCTNEIDDGGGIASINKYFHRYINRNLFDVSFLGTSDKNPEDIPYAHTAPYEFTTMEDRFDFFMERFADADIVQFFGALDPAVCEAAKSTGVPVLIELVHNFESGQLYDNIDLSICVSERVKAVQPYPGRAHVICNGIDLDDFSYEDSKIPGEKIILLESCRRDKWMHFHLDDLADELLEMHPDIELWLAGSGQNGRSTDRVKYLGLQNNIQQIYEKADLLINLSRQESFGLAAVEAMASGCLPICSNDGGMTEIVDDGVDGWLVQADDKNRALEKIKQAIALRNSPSTWRDMQNRARKKAETSFNIQRWIREHENIYLRLIEKKGRRQFSERIAAPVPAEVHLINALFRSNRKIWKRVEKSLQALGLSDEKLRHPYLGDFLSQALACKLIDEKREDLAKIIYRKMYASGLRKANWMSSWLSLEDDPDIAIKIAMEVLELEPTSRTAIMSLIDFLLQKGNWGEAMKALSYGLKVLNEGKSELLEIYQMLDEKLSRSRAGVSA